MGVDTIRLVSLGKLQQRFFEPDWQVVKPHDSTRWASPFISDSLSPIGKPLQQRFFEARTQRFFEPRTVFTVNAFRTCCGGVKYQIILTAGLHFCPKRRLLRFFLAIIPALLQTLEERSQYCVPLHISQILCFLYRSVSLLIIAQEANETGGLERQGKVNNTTSAASLHR